MSIEKIIITILGLALIKFVWWFFFGKKEEEISGKNKVNIIVNGGYKPGIIKVKRGSKIELIFTRVDPNPCLEDIVIPDFKIKKYLPLNKPIEVLIHPDNIGTYRIQCGMNMFHGKIIVE